MVEPATWWDIKLVWHKESRTSNQRLILLTVTDGHSLSLSVKDTTKNCKLLSDTMDTAKEIVSLIKFSPKRENLLGEIKENLEGPESEAKGILGLCPTRWTVRTSCFQRILDSYTSLLQEWTISLVRYTCKYLGCQAQMNTFFFALNLGKRLFSHTKTTYQEPCSKQRWQPAL